jgi:hypothetical protein
MKGNPAVPGGSLTSKPTWLNTSGCSPTSAFFFAFGDAGRSQSRGDEPMDDSNSTVAQQIARAGSDFERQITGHVPMSVTVVPPRDHRRGPDGRAHARAGWSQHAGCTFRAKPADSLLFHERRPRQLQRGERRRCCSPEVGSLAEVTRVLCEQASEPVGHH